MILSFIARRGRRFIKWLLAAAVLLSILFLFYHGVGKRTLLKPAPAENPVIIEDWKDPPKTEKPKIITLPPLKSYDAKSWPAANYDVHVFYYAWYGNPSFDMQWYHWNHRYLPHWEPTLTKRFPRGRHEPPHDVGTNYYPQLGPYSSRDPEVVERHMSMIRQARIGVVAVSWYPNGQSDGEGFPPDPLIPLILEKADKYDVKVCIHIEPFEGRNAENMKKAIEYIIDRYGSHRAFYRHKPPNRDVALPLFYIYDSYQVDTKEWNKVFGRLSELSIRDTAYDGIFIGLVVEAAHQEQIYNAGFDGMYTYFASNTFVYGSKPSNWNKISMYCKTRDLMFIPSVGPGYIDTEVRPWNGQNTKKRDDGVYYRREFKQALMALPDIVSITSFNEWHEGTQIEPAVPHVRGYGVKYLDYGAGNENMYLNLTKELIDSMPVSRKMIDKID